MLLGRKLGNVTERRSLITLIIPEMVALHKICEKTGFHWSVFSYILAYIFCSVHYKNWLYYTSRLRKHSSIVPLLYSLLLTTQSKKRDHSYQLLWNCPNLLTIYWALNIKACLCSIVTFNHLAKTFEVNKKKHYTYTLFTIYLFAIYLRLTTKDIYM